MIENGKVHLQTIMEQMGEQIDDFETLLNRETGEVILIETSDLRRAEDIESEEELVEMPGLAQAFDVLENEEKYVPLPTQWEVDEFSIMEDFSYELHDGQKRSILLNAIKGKGAFRRFKDIIIDLGIRENWFTYRDKRYKQLAIEWCEENGIDYVE